MKNLRTLCLLALIALFSHCSTSRNTVKLGNKVAQSGSALVAQVLKSYDLIAQLSTVDKKQQDLIRLLSYPNPAAMQLPDTRGRSLKYLPPKIAAFQSLKLVYAHYEELSDAASKDQINAASAALVASYVAITQLPAIPTSVQQMIPEGAADLTLGNQANKVREQNEAIRKLTSAYFEVWKKDVAPFKAYANRIYKDYYDAVLALPNSRFNPAAIQQYTGTPYRGDYNVISYKMKVRDDALGAIDNVNQTLDQTTDAFQQLIAAHNELSQKPVSQSNIINLTNSMNNTLSKLKN